MNTRSALIGVALTPTTWRVSNAPVARTSTSPETAASVTAGGSAALGEPLLRELSTPRRAAELTAQSPAPPDEVSSVDTETPDVTADGGTFTVTVSVHRHVRDATTSRESTTVGVDGPGGPLVEAWSA